MPPVIVIPAYQPEPKLIPLVAALVERPDQHVIIVNDGSSSTCATIFEGIRRLPRVDVLDHAINLGKGQALKTAFNYFLLTYGHRCCGVVTADADGQHLVEDIGRVRAALEADPGALHLGMRTFRANVPWKSAVGNSLTRAVFRGLIGHGVHDTQTGLRGIPTDLLRRLLRIRANGYEFELEMLLAAMRHDVTIHEVPIATIYEDENRSTHFDPVWDSLRIYFVFVRFAVLSLSTAALDFLVFSAVHSASSNILASTMVARVFAGGYNFYMARTLVFRSTKAAAPELLKFVALIVWLMCVSYVLVSALVRFGGLGVYSAKVIAETGLFVANFAVQHLLVFRRASDE